MRPLPAPPLRRPPSGRCVLRGAGAARTSPEPPGRHPRSARERRFWSSLGPSTGHRFRAAGLEHVFELVLTQNGRVLRLEVLDDCAAGVVNREPIRTVAGGCRQLPPHLRGIRHEESDHGRWSRKRRTIPFVHSLAPGFPLAGRWRVLAWNTQGVFWTPASPAAANGLRSTV